MIRLPFSSLGRGACLLPAWAFLPWFANAFPASVFPHLCFPWCSCACCTQYGFHSCSALLFPVSLLLALAMLPSSFSPLLPLPLSCLLLSPLLSPLLLLLLSKLPLPLAFDQPCLLPPQSEKMTLLQD